MSRFGKYIIVGFCLGFVLCMLMSLNSLKNKDNSDRDYEFDSIEIADEDMAALSSHIFVAEYCGMDDRDYQFKIENVYKGDGKTDEVIFAAYNNCEYEVGKSYILFLEKSSSVYHKHDQYAQLLQESVGTEDPRYEELLQIAEEYVQDSVGAGIENMTTDNVYGNPYTNSSDIKDILAVSENIFAVYVYDIFAESTVNEITVYKCAVTKAIQNTPANNGDILIPFFNETVGIGKEYIVLLSNAEETAPVYTLSSLYSVYTIEEASELIPGIYEKYKESLEYATIIEEPDFNKDLSEEKLN